MIVLNLACAKEHRFEGWFASSDAFEAQLASGLLSCPLCNGTDIVRLPSGPRIVGALGEAAVESPAGDESLAAVERQLREALRTYVRGSEDVGERFPEEARRIHYKEAPARSIRGVASAEETHELLDEGIVVLPLLVPPNEETH